MALGLGEYAAPMGTGAALVLLACGLFLWSQKDAHMSASVSFLVPPARSSRSSSRGRRVWPTAPCWSTLLPRLQCVRDELLTGAVLFSAVFLINEPYTCVPTTGWAACCTACWWAVVSMGFRYYGVYETGVCFARAGGQQRVGVDRPHRGAKLYRLLHPPAGIRCRKGGRRMRTRTG